VGASPTRQPLQPEAIGAAQQETCVASLPSQTLSDETSLSML
jgi:hypothetical protein